MDISEAIHKSTMLPRQNLWVKGQGEIKERVYGDLVIFDEDRIIDKATFEQPFLEA